MLQSNMSRESPWSCEGPCDVIDWQFAGRQKALNIMGCEAAWPCFAKCCASRDLLRAEVKGLGQEKGQMVRSSFFALQ